ncbi:MAG: hypothetical protein ACYC8W_10055 [Candidatus Tyrphobacter sp.]
MKNANRLGSTLGLTFGALYVLCSLFFGRPQGYASLTVGYVASALYTIILDAMSGTTKVS